MASKKKLAPCRYGCDGAPMIDKQTLERLKLDVDYWKGVLNARCGCTPEEMQELIAAAEELQSLQKCNGEDVIGGHEPILHSDCCPLCREIGDYNEVKAELATAKAELERVRALSVAMYSPTLGAMVYWDAKNVPNETKYTFGQALDVFAKEGK